MKPKIPYVLGLPTYHTYTNITFKKLLIIIEIKFKYTSSATVFFKVSSIMYETVPREKEFLFKKCSMFFKRDVIRGEKG